VVTLGGGVHVGRDEVDEGVGCDVLGLDVLGLDVGELEGVVDVDDVVLEGLVSLVSCRGRSCTGGGSEGAAATRNPSSTSRGTQSSAASSKPSRPMRRPVLMPMTLGSPDDPMMRAR
jgi:hypothetical protein